MNSAGGRRWVPGHLVCKKSAICGKQMFIPVFRCSPIRRHPRLPDGVLRAHPEGLVRVRPPVQPAVRRVLGRLPPEGGVRGGALRGGRVRRIARRRRRGASPSLIVFVVESFPWF